MSNSRRHHITVYAQTDVGMVRAGNEDTFLVLNLDTSDTWTPVTVEGEPPDHLASFDQGDAGTILAVSDGMGGALAGEVASRMAVEGVRNHMLFFQTSPAYSSFPFHERLRLSVEQANSQINNESMGNADYAGMGATFTAAGVHDGHLTLAQIGDSRCYLIRGGRIALVTHDQSLVWQLVEAGHITEEEAETHQYKNVILQALGAQPRVNVVVDRIPLNDGDTILLCSDGLSGRVRAEEMLALVEESDSLKTACERLIQLANERGGEDNITVVVARFEGEALPPPGELSSERIERDPNLPYDIEEDVYAEAEDTLNPDRPHHDDGTAASDAQAGRFGSDGTGHGAGPAAARQAEPETALLDASKVSSLDAGDDGATTGLTADVAERFAKIHDPAKEAVPTMVGIPALTVDEIAADARLRDAATTRLDEPPAAAAAVPARTAPASGRRFAGTMVALAVVVLVGAGAWYVYQQRATVAADRARSEQVASGLGQRARQARSRLGALSASIDGMTPGPDQTEAMRLRGAILANLDRVEPLVAPGAAAPESLPEAETLTENIEGDINRLQSLVASAARPQAAEPGALDSGATQPGAPAPAGAPPEPTPAHPVPAAAEAQQAGAPDQN